VARICARGTACTDAGHGKAALAAYFLGQEARIGKGLRVALTAALLHVLSGLTAFLILRFVLSQAPSVLGRASPTFTAFGYALIILSGAMMLAQSAWSIGPHRDGAHPLTAGIGLLPCPLTISVLGFAWLQATALMVIVALVALALGIATTIGLVALLAIFARRRLSATIAGKLPQMEPGSRILQGISGGAIVILGLLALARAY